MSKFGRPNKIRQAAKEAEVRRLTAKGLTYRQISAELAKQGVTISHVAVGRFIIEETEERKAAARSVASEDAKTTVPLVTKALTQLVHMNMTAAKKAYRGTGSDKAPDPAIRELAAATTAAVQALKSLHAVTVGDAPATGQMDGVRDQVLGILASKQKRAAEDED